MSLLTYGTLLEMETYLLVLTVFAAVKNHVYGLTACPDNWIPYDGSCYYFSRGIGNFEASEKYCQQMSAYLVEMNTRAENEFIKKQVRGFRSTSWWIGLSDRLEEGVFMWVHDQSPLNFTDWYPGQPNDRLTDEDCITLYTNYNFSWSDYNCEAKTSHPICEKRGYDASIIVG